MSLPVTITPNAISMLLDGRMRVVPAGSINFEKVKSLVQRIQARVNDRFFDVNDTALAELRELLDIKKFVATMTEGRVQVGSNSDGHDEVRFDGAVVRGSIAERLIQLLRGGYDIKPLMRFLGRVTENPTLKARDEIFLFMESGNLPLVDDGCFLAFKKVGSQFESGHKLPNGDTLYNRPGEIVTMPREDVDPDRHNTCSRGLHFCSWQYLPSFGVNNNNSDKVVVVKIAPEDVVSIPSDYNNTKGRTWKYLVLNEVPAEECEHLFANTPVVDSWGAYDNSEDDSDWPVNDPGEDDGSAEYADCCGCGNHDTPKDEPVNDAPVILNREMLIDGNCISVEYIGPENIVAQPGAKGLATLGDDERYVHIAWDDNDPLIRKTAEGVTFRQSDGCYRPEHFRVLPVVKITDDIAMVHHEVEVDVEHVTNGFKKVDDLATTQDDTEVEEGPVEPTFKYGRRTFSGSEIKHLVENYGQRGVERLIKVPRTTLQGWIKKIG